MMKKNLKYLLALLCIIVLLLCTGCSSNNAAPQPISITVWTYYSTSHKSGHPFTAGV